MRTTLDLEEDLLQQLLELSRAKTKSQAVNLAIAEYVRQRKIRLLKGLSGRLQLEENWEKLRQLELDEPSWPESS